MLETVINHNVETYHDDGAGHTKPHIPVIITPSAKGIQVQLGVTPHHYFGNGGSTKTPDVFFERRPTGWFLAITPDGGDVGLSISLYDSGTLEVVHSNGNKLLVDE